LGTTGLAAVAKGEQLPATAHQLHRCLAGVCTALESTFEAEVEGVKVSELLAILNEHGPSVGLKERAVGSGAVCGDADSGGDGMFADAGHLQHPWTCTCTCFGWDRFRQHTTCVLQCSVRKTPPIVDGYLAKLSALAVAADAAATLIRTSSVVVLGSVPPQ
jgi:hypothetical protein